ncbi:MAG: hypothetical protein INR73_24160 [Williamsia sp.]|nr:hypothetical protein [Williamsia sp.]
MQPPTGTLSDSADTAGLHDTSFPARPYAINNIIITGNKKTKPYIIEREFSFHVGDSLVIDEVLKRIEQARRQLMNTRLFNEVVITLQRVYSSSVDVAVDVKERWYLFPFPFFKPVDRNLTEWAKQGYGIDRVNYGAKFAYYNVTGRNDKLKAQFINGYTPQLQFSYEQPNADKTLKHGFGISLSYTTAKEVNYLTQDNEQRFIPLTLPRNVPDTLFHSLFHKQVLNEQFNATLTYTYRPAIRTRHTLRLAYNINKIDRAVLLANPNYYSNNKLSIAYPEFIYTVEYNNADYIIYPLTGFTGDASFTKRGISKDMNLWQVNARGTIGWKVANKLFFGLQGYGVVKVPFDQPYVNLRMLGYGDAYLRGLEKYVIDGVAGGMVRSTLRREVLNFSVPLFNRFRSLDRIPFRIYLKTYADAGYSYSRDPYHNPLTNRLLHTYGAGLDIVTFYDFVFRFEYSFNQLAQKGLFLHIRNDF